MHYYTVKFKGTPNKEYLFSSRVILPIGQVGNIIADNKTTYNNPVVIHRKITKEEIFETCPIGMEIREITSFTPLVTERRPDNFIHGVYFNEEKGTTCVVWKDGRKTIVKCQPCDTFSKEVGLAMCYMKRFLGNRGSFNETLKQYCYGEDKNA